MVLENAWAVHQHQQSRKPMTGGADLDRRTWRDYVSDVMDYFLKPWKQRGTNKHWVVHARVNLGMIDISVSDIQIADQLRGISLFDVFVYVPSDAEFSTSDMTDLPLVDQFAILQDSLLTVMRLVLNEDVPEYFQPLQSIACLDASFKDIADKFRSSLIIPHSAVRSQISVLTTLLNRDFGKWESDLSKFVRDIYSGTVPHR